MLSGETASGKYPLEAVRTMADTVLAAEQAINYWGRFQKMGFSKRAERPISDAISHSCCTTALDLEAKAILVATQSGNSAGNLPLPPSCTIAAFTTTERVRRQLAITWVSTHSCSGQWTPQTACFPCVWSVPERKRWCPQRIQW